MPTSGTAQFRADGPLKGRYYAAAILGAGSAADLVANGQGGFDGYPPRAALPGYGMPPVQPQPAQQRRDGG